MPRLARQPRQIFGLGAGKEGQKGERQRGRRGGSSRIWLHLAWRGTWRGQEGKATLLVPVSSQASKFRIYPSIDGIHSRDQAGLERLQKPQHHQDNTR